MDAIAPEFAKRLLNRDFANLVKRIQAGGKLSRTERTMLIWAAMALLINSPRALLLSRTLGSIES